MLSTDPRMTKHHQPVTPWRRARLSAAAAYAAAAVLLVPAIVRFRDGDTAGELALVATAATLALIGWWLSSGRPLGPQAAAVVACAAAAVVAWYRTGDIPPTVGVGAGLFALIAGAARRLITRGRRADQLEGLAAVLASITGDPRPPHRIVRRPRWSAARLDRALWNAGGKPIDVDSDNEKKSPKRAIATALGKDYRIEARAGGALIYYQQPTAQKADSELEEETPRDVRRINANLASSIGPGAQIDKYVMTDSGELSEFVIAWPEHLSKAVASLSTRSKIQQLIASVLGTAIRIEWQTKHDKAVITVRKQLPTFIGNPGSDKENPNLIHFGIDRDGDDAVWDMDAPDPHILIVGGTGGGKTSTLRTILTVLPAVELVLVDPKRIELKAFEGLPGVILRARTAEEMRDAIDATHTEMMRRYELADTEGEDALDALGHRVLVIDEGKQLYDMLKRHWNDVEKPALAEAAKGDKTLPRPSGTEPPVWGKLNEILQLGRVARMNVVMCTQQPAGYWMGTDGRSNYGVRIACGALESVGSDMTFGSRIATAIPGGAVNGRAWAVTGKGQTPILCQVYWTPKLDQPRSEDDRAILGRLDLTKNTPALPATAVDADQRPVAGALPVDDEPATVDSNPTPPPNDDEPADVPPTRAVHRRPAKIADQQPAAGALPVDDDGRETAAGLPPERHLHLVPAGPVDDEPAELVDDEPAELVDDEPAELVDDDEGDAPSELVDPWTLDEGRAVQIELDGQSVRALVVSVEHDDLDPDRTALTVKLASGDLEAVSLEAGEKVNAR